MLTRVGAVIDFILHFFDGLVHILPSSFRRALIWATGQQTEYKASQYHRN